MIRHCSVAERQSCAVIRKKHRSNLHHTYFPKRLYQTPIENAFRDLPEHTVQMCIPLHDRLHETTEPPEKPDLLTMLAALSVSFEVDLSYEQAA